MSNSLDSYENYDYLFKIMLVGDSGVGKSTLLLRMCGEKFNPTFFPTIGVDFKIMTFTKNSSTTKLQIWDTAGQERFKAITSAYYKGAHGVIVVFDIANKDSFRNVENWLADIEEFKTKNVVRFLVGNKADLEVKREVPYETANEFANRNGMVYIETSAKSDKNIDHTLSCINEEMKNEFGLKGKEKSNSQKEDILLLGGKTLILSHNINSVCKC